jgi:hypothetical protein
VGGSDYQFFDPLSGEDTTVIEGVWPTGVVISIGGNASHPEGLVEIRTINLFGVGTAPIP